MTNSAIVFYVHFSPDLDLKLEEKLPSVFSKRVLFVSLGDIWGFFLHMCMVERKEASPCVMVDGSAMVIDYAIVLLFDNFLKSLEAIVKKGYRYCSHDFKVLFEPSRPKMI